jgi:hypothetical protein
MLAISSNGKERTEREFADLFAKAGLALVARRSVSGKCRVKSPEGPVQTRSATCPPQIGITSRNGNFSTLIKTASRYCCQKSRCHAQSNGKSCKCRNRDHYDIYDSLRHLQLRRVKRKATGAIRTAYVPDFQIDEGRHLLFLPLSWTTIPLMKPIICSVH